MTDEAGKLDVQIGQHIAERDKLIEQIRELEKKVDYRNRCIRELSAKRTVALNFTLPLNEP